MLIKCPNGHTRTKMVSKSRKLYRLQCLDCGCNFSIDYDDMSDKRKAKESQREAKPLL